MKGFKNKTVVVTGAGSGIGRALALAFAGRGANLALSDIGEAGLLETKGLAEAKGAKVLTHVFDVAVNEEFLAFADLVEKEMGAADVVINNAGITHRPVTIEALSIAEITKVMDINFWGMVYGTKAFIPQLKKDTATAVVNISSIFGIIGAATQGAYCASKFGIRGFTEVLATEMYQTNLQVHSVHPGNFKTNIANNMEGGTEAGKKHANKLLTRSPEIAADLIIKGIEKKKTKILLGSDARMMELAARLSPFNLVNYFTQKMIKKGHVRLG